MPDFFSDALVAMPGYRHNLAVSFPREQSGLVDLRSEQFNLVSDKVATQQPL
jgi:hypothetical protein